MFHMHVIGHMTLAQDSTSGPTGVGGPPTQDGETA
jgi:hypothetical protein